MLPSTSLCLEWRPLLAQQQVLRRGGGHTHFTDEDSVRQGRGVWNPLRLPLTPGHTLALALGLGCGEQV